MVIHRSTFDDRCHSFLRAHLHGKREREGGAVLHRYEHAMVIQLVAALAAEMLAWVGANFPFEPPRVEGAQRWLGEARGAKWQPLAEEVAVEVAASFYPDLRWEAYREDLHQLRRACAITNEQIGWALRQNASFHRRRFSEGAEEVFYDGVRGLLVLSLRSQNYPLAEDVPDPSECAGMVLRLREWWQVLWRQEAEEVAGAAFRFLQEERLLVGCTGDSFNRALWEAGRRGKRPPGRQAQEILRRCQAARLAGMVVRGGGSLLFTPPDEKAAQAQMAEFDWGGWYHQATLAAEAAFRAIVPPAGRLDLKTALRRVWLSGVRLGSGDRAPDGPQVPLGVPLVRGRRQ